MALANRKVAYDAPDKGLIWLTNIRLGSIIYSDNRGIVPGKLLVI